MQSPGIPNPAFMFFSVSFRADSRKLLAYMLKYIAFIGIIYKSFGNEEHVYFAKTSFTRRQCGIFLQ